MTAGQLFARLRRPNRDFVTSDANLLHGCQMSIAGFLESFVFGPLSLKDYSIAALCYTERFDPSISLDCARVEDGGAEGIKFCHLATLISSHSLSISLHLQSHSDLLGAFSLSPLKC